MDQSNIEKRHQKFSPLKEFKEDSPDSAFNFSPDQLSD